MRKLEKRQTEERCRGIRRKKSIRFRQRVFLLSAFCMIMIFSCGYALASDTGEREETVKNYTSIEVQSGDTLWDIAGKYASEEYSDREAYISEIKQLNHLTDDNISAGVYLVIPYYTTM